MNPQQSDVVTYDCHRSVAVMCRCVTILDPCMSVQMTHTDPQQSRGRSDSGESVDGAPRAARSLQTVLACHCRGRDGYGSVPVTTVTGMDLRPSSPQI